MTRAVYFAGSALLCARGDSPAAVADALWTGECMAGRHHLGQRDFPYFGLPLAEQDWLARAEQAVDCIAAQLGPLAADTPLFVASSSFRLLFRAAGRPLRPACRHADIPPTIAEWLELSGARYSLSNACISGFSAIMRRAA